LASRREQRLGGHHARLFLQQLERTLDFIRHHSGSDPRWGGHWDGTARHVFDRALLETNDKPARQLLPRMRLVERPSP